LVYRSPRHFRRRSKSQRGAKKLMVVSVASWSSSH
jgi:hypothetical protein